MKNGEFRMKRLLLILLTLIIAGCEKEYGNPLSQTEQINDKLVAAQIDLQFGFAGKFVNIKFNGQDYFQAYLENVAPLAGPEAKFSTFLPHGKNVINIEGRYLDKRDKIFDISTDFELNENEINYIGIVMDGNSIHVQVQNHLFGYY